MFLMFLMFTLAEPELGVREPMNKNTLVSIYFIFILLFTQSFVHSAEWSGEYILKHHQAHISNIYTCGSWKNNELSGFYRIIQYDFLFGCSWLYIQWMKDYKYDDTTKALHTLSIYTNDHHENTFEVPKYKATPTGIKLFYEAINGHNNKKYNIEIDVFNEFGKHKLIKNEKKIL